MNTPAQWPKPSLTAREAAQAHRHFRLPWYAGLAVAAGIFTVAILVILHVIMAGKVRINIDPVSVYAINQEGVLLFDLACMAIAAACVAVLFGHVGTEPVPRWCLAGSAVALLFVVGFDTDAGATVSTIGGYVHRYAAGVVFILVTVAAAHMWRRLSGSGLGRTLGVLTFLNLILLILNVSGTYLPNLANGGQWRGIPQRLLLLSLVVSIVVLAFVPKPFDRWSWRTPDRTRPRNRIDNSWESKDWLTGRGTTGWGALPSRDGL